MWLAVGVATLEWPQTSLCEQTARALRFWAGDVSEAAQWLLKDRQDREVSSPVLLYRLLPAILSHSVNIF